MHRIRGEESQISPFLKQSLRDLRVELRWYSCWFERVGCDSSLGLSVSLTMGVESTWSSSVSLDDFECLYFTCHANDRYFSSVCSVVSSCGNMLTWLLQAL